MVFLFFMFIIYLLFLSNKYLKNEVQSGISLVQSIIPLFYNICCILHPDFNGTKKTHIPRNQKDRNCSIFSPLLQDQMRVPAPPVPQASPRAVSELTNLFCFFHLCYISKFSQDIAAGSEQEPTAILFTTRKIQFLQAVTAPS